MITWIYFFLFYFNKIPILKQEGLSGKSPVNCGCCKYYRYLWVWRSQPDGEERGTWEWRTEEEKVGTSVWWERSEFLLMSLQFCLPLVSFIYEAPSCASRALLELQTCTKVFRAGTVSVCGTGCTCIFLKSSLKHRYSDTHTGSTFSSLSNSLLFYNTKLEERWRNENIFFFFYRKL